MAFAEYTPNTESQVSLAVADTIANIFHDRFLAHVVAEHLEVSVETVVTQATLDSIQSLSTSNLWQIQNLQGIQFLRNLTWLDLSHNRISNIQPLSGLTELTHLNLWANWVNDLSPLAELSNLTLLDLGRNNVTDISPLVGLSNLTSLNLHGQRGDNFVSWASSLTIPVHMQDVNGNLISPTFISNNGIYRDGTITWTNLSTPRVNARETLFTSYEWNQPVQVGDVSVWFSGRGTIHFLPFQDVNQSDWFCNYVWATTHNGWIIGTSGTTFSPNEPLTRAAAVTILHRMVDEKATPFQPIFNDVVADRWYSSAVTWAYQSGIVKGVGGGRFAPNDPVTREQLATMMLRAAPHFIIDAPVVPDNIVVPEFEASPWAYDAMRLAAVFDFISVEAPTSPASRAESVALIVRFIDQFFRG